MCTLWGPARWHFLVKYATLYTSPGAQQLENCCIEPKKEAISADRGTYAIRCGNGFWFCNGAGLASSGECLLKCGERFSLTGEEAGVLGDTHHGEDLGEMR